MAEQSLFEFVKHVLRVGPEGAKPPRAPRRTRGRAPGATPPQENLDAQNPATIVQVGRTNDGRELIMTLGMGTFLVDREMPAICYFVRGGIADIPTPQLGNLVAALHAKQDVEKFARHYVDLLNVASHEMDMRVLRSKQGANAPRPRIVPPGVHAKPPQPKPPSDSENPANILRVGRSTDGADLIMTQGLGTFLVHRERLTLRYFDRGREWDVPDNELDGLIACLMAKQEVKEHRFAYVDLLNVANHIRESRRPRRR